MRTARAITLEDNSIKRIFYCQQQYNNSPRLEELLALEKEYDLIKAKKSNLSANQRRKVISICENNKKGE